MSDESVELESCSGDLLSKLESEKVHYSSEPKASQSLELIHMSPLISGSLKLQSGKQTAGVPSWYRQGSIWCF